MDDNLIKTYENKEYAEMQLRIKNNLATKKVFRTNELVRHFDLTVNNMNELHSILLTLEPTGSNLEVNINTHEEFLTCISQLDYSLLMATSSMFSFIEMKNAIIEEYKETDFYQEFRSEQHLLPNGEFDFLIKLRHYLTKYNLAPWVNEVKSYDDGTFRKILIDRDTLLRSDIWRGASKKFLRTNTRTFSMLPILEVCIKEMRIFWPMMLDKLQEMQDVERQEANELIRQSNLALSGGKFESAEEFKAFTLKMFRESNIFQNSK